MSWEGESGGRWFHEEYFKILSEDAEVVDTAEGLTCNTRKSRDKRERRHTVGLLVGAYPCGTIVIVDLVVNPYLKFMEFLLNTFTI